MSARESWTKRRAESEEAMPGGALALMTPMSAMNRCDRCGAQAYVRIILRSRQDLLFCAHHYRQHALALANVAFAIQDETQRLTLGEGPGFRA